MPREHGPGSAKRPDCHVHDGGLGFLLLLSLLLHCGESAGPPEPVETGRGWGHGEWASIRVLPPRGAAVLRRGSGERPAVTQVESSIVSVRGGTCGPPAVDREDPPHVSGAPTRGPARRRRRPGGARGFFSGGIG